MLTEKHAGLEFVRKTSIWRKPSELFSLITVKQLNLSTNLIKWHNAHKISAYMYKSIYSIIQVRNQHYA